MLSFGGLPMSAMSIWSGDTFSASKQTQIHEHMMAFAIRRGVVVACILVLACLWLARCRLACWSQWYHISSDITGMNLHAFVQHNTMTQTIEFHLMMSDKLKPCSLEVTIKIGSIDKHISRSSFAAVWNDNSQYHLYNSISPPHFRFLDSHHDSCW